MQGDKLHARETMTGEWNNDLISLRRDVGWDIKGTEVISKRKNRPLWDFERCECVLVCHEFKRAC